MDEKSDQVTREEPISVAPNSRAANPRPGSVDHVVRFLRVWLEQKRNGVVWVEFDADIVRDEAIERLGVPSSRLKIDQASTREDWLNLRGELEKRDGIVHVTFSGALGSPFLPPTDVRHFAQAMNIDRETVFELNLQQIWWLRKEMATLVRPWAPDFHSWLNLRLELDEEPRPASSSFPINLGPLPLEATSPLLGDQIGASVIGATVNSIPQMPVELVHGQFRDLIDRASELINTGKYEEASDSAHRALHVIQQNQPRDYQEYLLGCAHGLFVLAEAQRGMKEEVEAFRSMSNAVNRYRDLTNRNRDVFLPFLPSALDRLIGIQLQIGRVSEALESAKEAVALERELAATKAGKFMPDLATQLDTSANVQFLAGQIQEALRSALEALKIRRELVPNSGTLNVPVFASSLGTVAILQSLVGLDRDSIESFRELSELLPLVPPDDRPPILSVLATLLFMRAISVFNAGRLKESLDLTEAVVGLYRELVGWGRRAYLPSLAASVHTLGILQFPSAQPARTATLLSEAVKLRRELVETDEAKYSSSLADSLGALGGVQSILGLKQDALDCTMEAVEIQRRIAKARGAVSPGLASALVFLAHALRATGRVEDALATAKESVDIYRELCTANHDANVQGLANAVSTLANVYAALDKREEALAWIEQAIAIQRRLIHESPKGTASVFAFNLATTLIAWGQLLVESGDHGMASQKFYEALQIMVPLERSFQGYADLFSRAESLYLQACGAAGIPPDANLVPAQPALG